MPGNYVLNAVSATSITGEKTQILHHAMVLLMFSTHYINAVSNSRQYPNRIRQYI
jgi:hypothetical protein